MEKLNEVIVSHSKAKVDALTEMKDYRRGIHAAEWETKVLDYQAEDLVIRTRDIQLLRVSKDMQEFLRSGDKKRDTGEVSALERRSEHNQIVGEGREYVARSTGSSSLVKMNVSRSQLFQGRINERKNEIHKISAKVASLQTENSDLESQLRSLDAAIAERQKIIDVQGIARVVCVCAHAICAY